MSILTAPWLKISLAAKYRILFGAAVILIIGAALSVPWMRIEALIDEQPFREAQRMADDFFRTRLANPPTAGMSDFHGGELRDDPLADLSEPRFVPRVPQLDTLTDESGDGMMSSFAASAMRRFMRRPGADFTYDVADSEHGRRFRYASAVRVTRSCLPCHSEGGTARPYRENELAGVITVDLSADYNRVQLIYNRLWLLGAGVMAGVLAILVFYVITRKFILSPIDELRDVATRVAEGDLDVRSALRTGDEFEELSAAVNRMLARLQVAREELRKANRLLDEKLEEMAETNVALYEANRVKTEFLANVTHELRTPLTSIIGFAELLQDNASATGEKPARYAENILISGRILLEMINDLLDLAKIEAGRVELHLESVRPADLGETLVEFMRPMADKKKQELVFSADENLPILITDRGKLRQVLYNLLSNALKFTPDSGKVTLRMTREGADRVRLAITDTGPGIAPEHQEMIFDKFRQIDGSATREHHGAGLGLAIAKELVTLLGGEIGVDSVFTMGATFWIKLPLVSADSRERQPVSLI